jgi:phosphopantothenoylcysteine decarboxylase / phosphopantothenate---cysteine ligase
MVLAGKHILLGVTGGIAVYKCPDLVRRLRGAGAEVQVVMTQGAQHFVTPLTFQAVSGRNVRTELWDVQAEQAMGHIELARWADRVLVAPATAGFLARLAHGHADDLLTTLCLATESPVIVAPAMNWVMWESAATQENVRLLVGRGVRLLGPVSGELAEGEMGTGRMLEPSEIVAAMGNKDELPFKGLRVLVTAGPTREPIDPVRFVSNRSSGKMGFAVARAAAEAGAEVTLVSGPVQLATPRDVRRIDVETAVQMHAAVMGEVDNMQIFVAAAAVADYAPTDVAREKIKKRGDSLELKLEKTPDILADVAVRMPRPYCVGFAAETEQLETHAKRKLSSKLLDMIAANLVGKGRGFYSDDNALSVYWKDGSAELESGPKLVLARQLVRLIAENYLRHS